ncbi:MAG: hypothetical protein QT11_C0001G0620 [archaeon GW2011_AR20]|nr:MAG: hypothetical protein QT11_C0001G0620 [archaeon GW2011_AR20]MBS3160890.1 NUDIX domain-containing protein [Candidatus Woesearchaeota archaeon]
MGKEDRLIMVVRKDDLFQEDFFEGFKSHKDIDYESRILKNYGFMTAKFAENDPTYKQPIRYCMIVNPESKRIFAYQRSKKDENYSEKRLQGKFSWGVGGHVEKSDITTSNPIQESMLRELNEEVEINGSINPKTLGYIYHDFGVNAVHFGILYLIETDSVLIKPKDPEIDNGELRRINDLEFVCNNPEYKVEDWSKTALRPLKEYLDGL